jgi:hypothetical protein
VAVTTYDFDHDAAEIGRLYLEMIADVVVPDANLVPGSEIVNDAPLLPSPGTNLHITFDPALTGPQLAALTAVVAANPDPSSDPANIPSEQLPGTAVSEMVGATGIADGVSGTVPKPLMGDEAKLLTGAATWTTVSDATDYAGRFEAASIGTGDIGLNKWGWWWDTVNSRMIQVRNRLNVLYCVELDQI